MEKISLAGNCKAFIMVIFFDLPSRSSGWSRNIDIDPLLFSPAQEATVIKRSRYQGDDYYERYGPNKIIPSTIFL
jgi:hypothetical protein